MRVLLGFLLLAFTISAADKYDGPRPPQPDLPYLLHASKLIPTEAADAQEADKKKNEVKYTVPGEASPAKTPLAEPIFLIDGDKINPERMELYQLEVKDGHRELTISERGRGGARPLKMSVTRLDGRLYRVEAAEMLDNGQYCLSPNDSNRAFCFEIY